MTRSEDSLQEAFAGESQANRMYQAFAEKADEEGYPQAARLFRAAAEAEAVHAKNHLKAMNKVKATKENLREAIAGETHEFKEMYPGMIDTARSEGDKAAERSFRYANDVEEIHARLYHDMMENLESRGVESSPYYVCPVCGMTAEKVPPERCPVCGVKGDKFKRID
jgi:rubrerythrin